jgi:hypothetical protein
VRSGLAPIEEIVAGCHCLAPRYLQAQIEQSLANLDLATVDIYCLHNPETQLEEVGGPGHHYRVIQLPFSLAMPEAWLGATQDLAGKRLSLLDAASRLGIAVLTAWRPTPRAGCSSPGPRPGSPRRSAA